MAGKIRIIKDKVQETKFVNLLTSVSAIFLGEEFIFEVKIRPRDG